MKWKRLIDELRYRLACRISPWVADVDYRFSCVLDDVTDTMSKTNYTLEAMYGEISAKRMKDDETAIDDYLVDSEDEDILERARIAREKYAEWRQKLTGPRPQLVGR